MKKNLYYTMVYKNSALKNNSVNALILLLEFPKTILLPFLRKDMGERYFSLLLALVIAGLIYFSIPYLRHTGLANVSHLYTFDVLFLLVSIIRYIQIRQAPSVFDFAKFSYSPGKYYPFFKKIKVRGNPLSSRTIDIFVEPAFAFIIGFIIAALFTSAAGILIMFCAICYSVSNLLKARLGDHYIMDRIDQIICNEELSISFAKGEELTPREVPISYPKRPSNNDLRNNISDIFKNDDDEDDDPDATVIA